MNRNTLYMIIGGLVVLLAVAGVYVYQQESKPKGVELTIGKDGVSVEKN